MVADNGICMDVDGLNSRYAIVGNTKVPDEALEAFEPRKPMGKKGIGKLASFSLGDEYEVFTRTSGDTLWYNFTVNYLECINEENRATYDVPVKTVDLPERFAEYAELPGKATGEVRLERPLKLDDAPQQNTLKHPIESYVAVER